MCCRGRHARAHVPCLSSHYTPSGPSRPSRRHPAHLAVGARQVLRQRQHDRQHGDNAQRALQTHNSQGAQVQVGQVVVLHYDLSGMQRLGKLRRREVGGSRVSARKEGSTQHPGGGLTGAEQQTSPCASIATAQGWWRTSMCCPCR